MSSSSATFPASTRFALARLGRDADAAEEVAQETLCKAINKLHTFRGEAALFTWLCTICRNELSDHFAKTARDRKHVVLTEDYPEIEAAVDSFRAPPADDPERGFQRLETGGRPIYPTFSPDGDWLAYVDASAENDALMRVALSGGAPRPIVPSGPNGIYTPSWSADGTIVYGGDDRRECRIDDFRADPVSCYYCDLERRATRLRHRLAYRT